ncbi:MAG: response regulator [Nitrososphaeraceae archaeon]
MGSEKDMIMLLRRANTHYSYPNLDIGISSFRYSDSNNSDQHNHHYLSDSSSLASSNYLRNQGSRLDTSVELEGREQPQAQSPFIKRILVVDDDPDLTLTFKVGLDNYYYGGKKRFEVYTYNDPLLVLTQFKAHFYDLLLSDIYMPNMNGFQLCEKILELDVNIRVCFISALEINIQALREVYPKVNFGCFIKKPVSIEYLIKRLSAELE